MSEEQTGYAAGGVVEQPSLTVRCDCGRVCSVTAATGIQVTINYSPIAGALTDVERERAAREMARRIERERRKLGL